MWLQTHWCDTTQSYITATSWLCILSYLAPFESDTPWAWASWALMMYDNSLFSKKWSMAAAPKLRKHYMTWNMYVRTQALQFRYYNCFHSAVHEALVSGEREYTSHSQCWGKCNFLVLLVPWICTAIHVFISDTIMRFRVSVLCSSMGMHLPQSHY